MSEPWWIADPTHPPGGGVAGVPPVAVTRARDLMRAIRARRPAFTPDWVDPPDADAGGALVQLFAEQLGTVAIRAERLPERAKVEFLNAAGIRLAPAQPASAVVQFTVSAAAGGSVLIPDRFQVGAGPVVFETQSDLDATPLEVASVRLAENDVRLAASLRDGALASPLVPFERPGSALEIGLAGAPNVAAPAPKLSIGFTLAPPGGLAVVEAGAETSTGPLLRWEVHVGAGRFAPAGIVADGTRGLTQSGIVVLRPPAEWRREVFEQESTPSRPAEPMFWLRVRVVEGKFATPPEVRAVRANVVDTRAVRTVRNEFVEPFEDDAAPDQHDRRRFRLQNVPVVPGSAVIEIDRPVLSDAARSRLPEDEANQAEERPSDVWTERETLAETGPNDRVFVLDPRTGELTFGDGVTGAAVPAGFRNVRAVRYEVGGSAGVVKAGAISQLISTQAFVTRVANPLPASGGTAGQTPAEAVRAGPRLVRSRGRAIGAADYENLALSARGADVRRAFALAARHPAHPGVPMPGVVGLWVVSSRHEGRPPSPDEGTLRAVAEHLATRVAPLGVRVIAAAPRFRRVRAEVSFVADPAADSGTVIGQLIDAIDEYFDPLTGGDEEAGWKFGGAIRHTALVRRLFARVPALRTVAAVRLLLDGEPFGDCQPVEIGETDLLWPDGHTVTPADAEGRP